MGGMAKEKGRSRYIDFIDAYCDRWCERCPFTDRCKAFGYEKRLRREMERKEREAAAAGAPTPWEEYEKQAEAIEPWLEEEHRAFAEREEKREEEIRNLPLTRRAEKYSDEANAWFDANHDRVKAAGPAQADALEVIGWYMHFIQIKLMRAQRLDDMSEYANEDDEPLPADARADLEEFDRDDNNGSAKVAMIGADRSIAAWAMLREKGEQVDSFIRQLDALRTVAEQVFPNARNFIRPGLDWPEELLE